MIVDLDKPKIDVLVLINIFAIQEDLQSFMHTAILFYIYMYQYLVDCLHFRFIDFIPYLTTRHRIIQA